MKHTVHCTHIPAFSWAGIGAIYGSSGGLTGLFETPVIAFAVTTKTDNEGLLIASRCRPIFLEELDADAMVLHRPNGTVTVPDQCDLPDMSAVFQWHVRRAPIERAIRQARLRYATGQAHNAA